MLVGMIQSNYIPWRGYFDFIASVDHFLLYDDVPLGMGRTWRNRNRIQTQRGVKWLTVPIYHDSAAARICDVRICYQYDWMARHCGQLIAAYRHGRYFGAYFPKFREIIHRRYERLSVLNEALIRWIVAELRIDTTITPVANLCHPPAPRDARPIEILKRLGATAYLTGPNTLSYTNCCAYRAHGISLRVKDYTYASYRPLGEDFIEDLSILDLLFSLGPTAHQHIRSHQRDYSPTCQRGVCEQANSEKGRA